MGKPAWVRSLLIAIVFTGAVIPTSKSAAQRVACQSGGEGANKCSSYYILGQCETSCRPGLYACCTAGGNCWCIPYNKVVK
jgi:hypothetical protein